jgi:TPR repeat protein
MSKIESSSVETNLDLVWKALKQGDYAQARETLGPLVKSGDMRAQFIMGELCEMGRGAEVDYPAAAECYCQAAGQGHVEAQYRLALCYEQGLGVQQDYQQAYLWSSLAVAGKCHQPEAQLLREKVGRQLSSFQLLEAQREATVLLENWHTPR